MRFGRVKYVHPQPPECRLASALQTGHSPAFPLPLAAIPVHDKDKHTDRTRSIWLSVTQSVDETGAPSRSEWRQLPEITLATASSLSVCWAFLVPRDWASGVLTVKLHIATITAGTGNIRIDYGVNPLSDGESSSTVPTNQDETVTPPQSAANIYDVITLAGTITVTAGEIVGITIGRDHDHADDTYTQNIYLYGIEIVYTADM